MGHPDAEVSLADADPVVELQKRDQRQLQRHDQKPDHRRDEERAAGEVHPGERVGGEGRDQDRDDGRRDRHRRGVEEGLPDADARPLPRQHGPVVVQGEFRRARGGREDARQPRSFERDGRGQHVVAAVVECQRLAVVEIGGLARRVGLRLARGGAPGADRGRAPGKERALDHERPVALGLVALDADRRQLLFLGRQGTPPPRRGNLVTGPEGRDQKPEGRNDPERDQKQDREMNRPDEGGFAAGDVLHVPAPYFISLRTL